MGVRSTEFRRVPRQARGPVLVPGCATHRRIVTSLWWRRCTGPRKVLCIQLKGPGMEKWQLCLQEIWSLPSLWVKFYHLCVPVTSTTICLDNVPDSITSVHILPMPTPFYTFYISTHSVHFQKQSLSINSYLQTTVQKRVINPGNQSPFSETEMHVRIQKLHTSFHEIWGDNNCVKPKETRPLFPYHTGEAAEK